MGLEDAGLHAPKSRMQLTPKHFTPTDFVHGIGGCRFARPEIANATYTKTFYPHGLRPWDGEWEEPAWAHARFARVSPCREKAAGLRPAPSWGRKAPDPFSFGSPHVRHDTSWAVTIAIASLSSACVILGAYS